MRHHESEGVIGSMERFLGRKGTETRQRLLDAGRQLLADVSAFQLTPVAIARAANLTSAGFYAYFENVGEFLKELVEEVTVAFESADLSFLDKPASLEAAIRKLVDQTLDSFTEYHPVLQYRNVLSERGDAEMLRLRARAALPRIAKLAELLIEGSIGGRNLSRADRVAEAAFLNAGIESLATTAQQRFDLGKVISWQRLREAQVRVVVDAISQRSPAVTQEA